MGFYELNGRICSNGPESWIALADAHVKPEFGIESLGCPKAYLLSLFVLLPIVTSIILKLIFERLLSPPDIKDKVKLIVTEKELDRVLHEHTISLQKQTKAGLAKNCVYM